MCSNFYCMKLLILGGLLYGLPVATTAQHEPDQSDSYLTPSDRISEEILAPNHRNVTLDELSPTGNFFINRKRNGITGLSEFAKPHYNIAGLQIDKQANRVRSLTTQRATVGLELVDARSGERTELQTPDDITISHIKWSPDGSKVAWMGHEQSETHLYVTDIQSGKSRKVTRQPLLAVLNTTYQWTADSRHIFTVLIPDNRGDEPVRSDTPGELKVRTTSEGDNRLRTYPSLLEDKFEGERLEYFITGQLVKLDTQRRRVQNIGTPAMIRNIDTAPSGDHVIVQTLQKPFSYIVPVSRFSWNEEVWNLDGDVLATLRTSEGNKGIPDTDVVESFGRKNIQWRPDGEGLSMIVEPQDDEDEGEETDEVSEDKKDNDDEKNRIVQWLPPFGDDNQHVIYKTKEDLSSVRYSENAEILFISERSSGDQHLFAYFLSRPDTSYTIYRYDRDEFYENPGSLSTHTGKNGVSSVRISDNNESVFLTGIEYFENVEENAPRPFINQIEIESGDKKQIFRSSEDYYETVPAILDNNVSEIIIRRESPTEYRNLWHVEVPGDDRKQLTENVDYNEAVTQAQRDRFKVKRADGIEFWMDVVMPRDWDGEPLAGLIWHYPREYDDQEDYNESFRRHNKNSYPGVGTRTADIMVKEGYAVLKPDWPIVGARGTSNDNFVWSIVQNSTAVIDAAEAKGYIDRHKMAIGGHSYGAFGTSNAMIHTSFFKAGIAGAGNYNRTLTPLGFQRERSDLWRGQNRYMQMSPIFWADRLDGALLMYHGEEDQNVGTFPINSERMFHALNGIGKTAAMYMYPHEAHGPASEETLLDMWRRWVDWLDYYVKNTEGESIEEMPAGG